MQTTTLRRGALAALPKSLALPAATLGALAANSASATIEYHDIEDITVYQNGQQIYFDLLGGTASNLPGSGADFSLWATGYGSWAYQYVFASTPFGGQTLCESQSTGWGFSKRLQKGAAIGDSSSFWANPKGSQLRYYGYYGEVGSWVPGDKGYLGLRLGNGSGGFHYGWADVSVGFDSVTLHSFAYESLTDTSIAAGQTGASGAVPEPSTYGALAALVAGSTILFARRRKQAA